MISNYTNMAMLKDTIKFILLVTEILFCRNIMFGVDPETDIIKRLYLKMSLDSISNIQNNRLINSDYDNFWNFEGERIAIIEHIEGSNSIAYCEHLGATSFNAASLNNATETINYGLKYENLAVRLNLIHSNNHALAMGAISWAYWQLSNFDKAIEYGYKEVNTRNELKSFGDADFTKSYDELRIKLFYAGRINESIQLSEELLAAMYDNSVGNAELSFQINSFLFEMYFNQMDYEHAKNKIIAYLNDSSFPAHQRYAYRMMGNYYFVLNNINKAIDCYDTCLELSRNDNFETACAYEGLANCYNRQGDVAKSNFYILKGNEILGKTIESDNWDMLVSNKNLANMYERIGNREKAIQIMEHVCKTAKDGWLSGSARHIEMAQRLIRLLIADEKFNRAIQILDGIKPYLEKNSTQYIQSIVDESECLHYLGNSKEALRILSDIDVDEHNIDDKLLYNYYNILSSVCIQLKDAKTAKMAADRMQKCVRSFNNIDKNLGLCYIGYIYYLIGDYKQSAEFYKEAVLDIKKNGLDYLLNYSPNYQLAQWTKFNHALKREIPHVANLICDELDFSDIVYDALIYAKGLLYTSEHLWKRSIINSGDTSLISKVSRLGQLSEFVLKNDSYDNINAIGSELLGLQLELSNYVKGNIPQYKNISISYSDIQKKLQNDDVCIEFALYQDELGEWCLCSLLLNKDMAKPRLFKLCKKSQLESISEEQIYHSDEMWRLVWEKMEPYLSHAKNIYFSPDDVLNTIAIEYLPDSNKNLMAEKYNMFRLTNTGEILNTYIPERFSIVAMGGFDYNSILSGNRDDVATTNKTYRDVLNSRSRFIALPAAKREVERIAHLFTQLGRTSRLVTDENGTLEYFKSLSGTLYDIIHLATHGFSCQTTGNQFDEENVLLQSGLVFAGINNEISKERNNYSSIATAYDVSLLDLSNIDFVNLSACKTGLGHISEEGVFGLQRGFKKAGVHSLLMSLWDVDDEATQLLMTSFYQNYLDGMSKREALFAAQKTVRETPGFEDPEYWAAFILLDALN